MATKNPRSAKTYLVTTPTGPRLIKALSSQGAVKYAVLGTHAAKLAAVDDILAHRDLKVEDATAEEDEVEA